jgi:hypothetical protein
MVEPPKIAARQAQEDPHLIWKTFVEFISTAQTVELDDVQMAAQLPYGYDSDMLTGGHGCYFDSQYQKLGDKLNVLILATLDALKIIGAHEQAEILAQAADLYFDKPRQAVNPLDIVSQAALADEFADLDAEYRRACPEIGHLLEKYVTANLDHFIKLV